MLTEQYHGGTNFGRSAGGPFITTSYDYDAPLDEYGNIYLFKLYFASRNIISWNTCIQSLLLRPKDKQKTILRCSHHDMKLGPLVVAKRLQVWL